MSGFLWYLILLVLLFVIGGLLVCWLLFGLLTEFVLFVYWLLIAVWFDTFVVLLVLLFG